MRISRSRSGQRWEQKDRGLAALTATAGRNGGPGSGQRIRLRREVRADLPAQWCARLSECAEAGMTYGCLQPLYGSGLALFEASPSPGEKPETCGFLGASPHPHPAWPDARAPGGCPKPRLVSRSDFPVPAQPRTSDLQPARFGSERPDPPNWGPQGMCEPEGDRKRCRGLTCVAASSVSWSGSKPIWTFFGRWRKHLQNLKSGRRHRRQNGVGGAHGSTRAHQAPEAPRGPHPRRPRGASRPARSPREALGEGDPIPKPRLFLPRPAPESGGGERISL